MYPASHYKIVDSHRIQCHRCPHFCVLEKLLRVIDAYNVDLKSFRDDFNKDVSGGELEPVLETIKKISRSDRHLEMEFLIQSAHENQKSNC